MWILPFLVFLLFAKASGRTLSGTARRGRNGRGVSGSLGRGGARVSRFSRESTFTVSGQPLRLVGAKNRWELTSLLNLKPLGTVKRVSKNRRPLQEGAKVRVTRPIGERGVSPINSGTETFTESFRSDEE